MRPVLLPNITTPTIPIISSNSSKEYFLRRFYGRSGTFGGLLSKDAITFDENLLFFYTQTPLSFLNSEKQNALINVDTSIVYYYNRNLSQNKYKGIFFSDVTIAEEVPPQKLSLGEFDPTDIHSFYMNPSLDILIFSIEAKAGQGEEDLYVSLYENGNWTQPINLGNTINTEGAEISPFLSKDKTTLFFSSSGHNSFGKGDLFVTRRMYNSWKVWSQPENLGPEINSSGQEAYLNIADDSIAYFISNKSGWGLLWQASLQTTPPNPFRYSSDEREYLTQEEVIDLFGFSIDSTLAFTPNETDLSSQSRELLWFIANSIISKPDIFINIVFLPTDTPGLIKEKSTIVEEYLTFLGISKNRITTHTLQDETYHTTDNDAVLNFYLKK